MRAHSSWSPLTRCVILTAALALALGACAKEGGQSEHLPLGASSESCGSCHEDQHDAWAGSAHGRAATSPIFEAMLPRVEEAWGAVARGRCESCHGAGPPSEADPLAEGAIACVSCHAAVGNRATRDGALVVDLDLPLAGPLADPAPTAAHRSRPSGFLDAPELCGTCHELTGPNLVEEPTFGEYLASEAAAEGQTCQSCHLPELEPAPLTNEGGRPRARRDHAFVGFDPPWGASEEEAARAAERTRALLSRALELNIEAGGEGEAEIRVRNVGAGHAVPTGATVLRDLWLDLELVEGDATQSFPRALELNDRPVAGERHVALLVEASEVEPGRLEAGEARAVRLRCPPGAELRAALYGRAIRQEVLAALSLERLEGEVPTHRIAARTVRCEEL